ncbi:hypothetical protein GZ77_16700 [Endozoicomonas montiporae]|uniref:Uncharacterized protein n=1 Tax=Endozoicomonas montiporae TaxID=1027273 RepID=A0A081N617_9GAMM|nr:hypothetical protein GZ77_16700 [Endozoicomonas montiporae]
MKYPRPHARLSDFDLPEHVYLALYRSDKPSPASSNTQENRSIREITGYVSKFYRLQDRGKNHFTNRTFEIVQHITSMFTICTAVSIYFNDVDRDQYLTA